jgi:hypothetical protein
LVGKINKGLAGKLGAAGAIEGGERFAVLLRRGGRRLRALLLGAFQERAGQIVAFGAAIRAGKLAVDENGAAALLTAG